MVSSGKKHSGAVQGDILITEAFGIGEICIEDNLGMIGNVVQWFVRFDFVSNNERNDANAHNRNKEQNSYVHP